jgi:hypothetical protein
MVFFLKTMDLDAHLGPMLRKIMGPGRHKGKIGVLRARKKRFKVMK